jgi:nitrilase
MPLLRQSLYAQNINLYLAPTADPRDTWVPLMRTIALEGRCVVLSANQCVTSSQLPSWITGEKRTISHDMNGSGSVPEPRLRRKSTIPDEDGNEIALPCPKDTLGEAIIEDERAEGEGGKSEIGDEYVSRGGSCIISPMGEVLSGPLWEEDGLLIQEVDFEDCVRGRLDFDAGGSYSRYVIFSTLVDDEGGDGVKGNGQRGREKYRALMNTGMIVSN